MLLKNAVVLRQLPVSGQSWRLPGDFCAEQARWSVYKYRTSV
jgi:hypothetical protein